MTSDEIIEIGFEPIPHFTIGDTHTFNLGRDRHLSINSVGTPNETLWICSTDHDDKRKITNLV